SPLSWGEDLHLMRSAYSAGSPRRLPWPGSTRFRAGAGSLGEELDLRVDDQYARGDPERSRAEDNAVRDQQLLGSLTLAVDRDQQQVTGNPVGDQRHGHHERGISPVPGDRVERIAEDRQGGRHRQHEVEIADP